jgi:hypothetical protein
VCYLHSGAHIHGPGRELDSAKTRKEESDKGVEGVCKTVIKMGKKRR